MKPDFSKIIACSDGQQREFHFARVNSVAIYYHVSVVDSNSKLVTATMTMDEGGRWRVREPDLPQWFTNAEPHLSDAVQLQATK